MTLIKLKASLALWQRREVARKKLHTEAQQDLLEARSRRPWGTDVAKATERRDIRSKQLKEARDMVALRTKQIAEKQDKKVRRPHERIRKEVRNQSSRRGTTPRIIVLHSTESHNRAGLSDLEAIWGWFDNPASSASSHVIVDNEGFSAKAVSDDAKAWTQAAFNPQALSVEAIAFASQSAAAWTDAQVEKIAQYIAYWSKKYNIPIAQSTINGVCTHKQLGVAGGGHHDPGDGFPFERCLKRARELRASGW